MNPSTSSRLKTKKSPPPKPLKKDSSHTLEMTSKEKSEILQKLSILEDILKKKDDKPLTFKEGCAYLGYAPSYLYKLTYRKVIPHYKPTGKIIFFSKSELDEWIYTSEERRVKSVELENTSASLSAGVRRERQDVRGEVKTANGSVTITSKDPNQIEMFRKAKGNSEEAKEEAEILIEFPLKSRRGKSN